MALVLKSLSALLILLGLAFSAVLNPNVIDAASARDYGGAGAAATIRLVPFILAAKWSWNKASGRRTSWGLIVILVVWVLLGLASLGQSRP